MGRKNCEKIDVVKDFFIFLNFFCLKKYINRSDPATTGNGRQMVLWTSFNNLTAHYNSQFSVSFHFFFTGWPSDAFKSKWGININMFFKKNIVWTGSVKYRVSRTHLQRYRSHLSGESNFIKWCLKVQEVIKRSNMYLKVQEVPKLPRST